MKTKVVTFFGILFLFYRCGFFNDVPKVVSIIPANGATGVSTSTSITVYFSRPITPSTVTSNSTDSSCSGSFQLSANSFNSCIQMSSQPTVSSDNRTFTISPASALSSSTSYQFKANSTVQDTRGISLPLFLSSFITGDSVAPSLVSTVPANNATGVAVATDNITFIFSEAMNDDSITTNTANTSCSGTLQVSSDGFSTCIQMSSLVSRYDNNTQYELTPSTNLSSGTTYSMRITTSATDSNENAITQVTNSFTTIVSRIIIYITNEAYNGDLKTGFDSVRLSADTKCQNDAPESLSSLTTFRAILFTAANDKIRDMVDNYSIPTADVYLIDNSTRAADNVTMIVNENPSLYANISEELSRYFWHGTSISCSTIDSDHDCKFWTSASSSHSGRVTRVTQTVTKGICSEEKIGCNDNRRLLCIAY